MIVYQHLGSDCLRESSSAVVDILELLNKVVEQLISSNYLTWVSGKVHIY